MSQSPRYRSLRGMPDILPREAYTRSWIENKVREVFKTFAFGEVRTPLLEDTEVFTRSIGANTDIVEKEMYSFTDRGGKNISLRPEGTASVVRAFIENKEFNDVNLVKLFYTGPMFRGERPQKGRLRQFYQIGAEIIGGTDPLIDGEIIICLNDLLCGLGVKGFTILVNSIGCADDRKKYKDVLGKFLSDKKDTLCGDCCKRLDKNVLRILDCKKPDCKDVVKEAPSIVDYLCGDCASDYDSLKEILTVKGVPFKEKTDLVRGLDYYTGIIFEVVHPALGAQDAVAAGGRYDKLSEEMGGPDVGATGFAIGVERLILTFEEDVVPVQKSPTLIVAIDEGQRSYAFNLVQELRAKGVSCDMDLTGRSFKAEMRKANREKRSYVVIVGEDEIKKEKFVLKDMENGEQDELSLEEIAVRLTDERKAC